MTEHAPLPVAGYTNQSEAKIALVNQNKRLEEQVLRQFDTMLDMAVSTNELDQRWLHIAKTHIEQGFMAMNRAVFRPTRVKL